MKYLYNISSNLIVQLGLIVCFSLLTDLQASDNPIDKFTFTVQSKTHGGITFRPFMGTANDIKVLLGVVDNPDVAELTCHHKPWSQVDGLIDRTVKGTPERWQSFFANKCSYDVAETHLVWIGVAEDGTPVARAGFAPYSLKGTESGSVSTLFCHIVPEYQKDGIASALLEKLPEFFPSARFVASVEASNTGVQAFLEKQGFSGENIADDKIEYTRKG